MSWIVNTYVYKLIICFVTNEWNFSSDSMQKYKQIMLCALQIKVILYEKIHRIKERTREKISYALIRIRTHVLAIQVLYVNHYTTRTTTLVELWSVGEPWVENTEDVGTNPVK